MWAVVRHCTTVANVTRSTSNGACDGESVGPWRATKQVAVGMTASKAVWRVTAATPERDARAAVRRWLPMRAVGARERVEEGSNQPLGG